MQEQFRKMEDKIRELAASFIFSCDEKNISKQLKMLEEAENKVPDDVEIWEKFQFDPLDTLLGHIDELEAIIKKGINLALITYQH